MYEARQRKERVNRRIEGGGISGVRQRMRIESYRKNHPIVEIGNIQNHIIQTVKDGNFRQINGTCGYITLAVDRSNFGHTYIIIELKEGVWMYHFRANFANTLAYIAKVVVWKGTFEAIKREDNKGKNPVAFISNRSMSFSELKVSGKKARAIKTKCDDSIGNGFFSLILPNIGIGNNCFSKVYKILKEAGFQLTWSSYLLSFVSPRLAIWLGSGFYDEKTKKISSYSYK